MTTFEVLSGRLTLDTSPWQNALRQAQPALAQFVANMVRAMDVLKVGITNVATALGAITPALTNLTAAGVKVGESLEKSLVKVLRVTQATVGALSAVGNKTTSWAPGASLSANRTATGGVVARTGVEFGSRPSEVGQLPRSDLRSGTSGPTLKAYGETLLAQFERNAELLGKDRETSLKSARDSQLAFEAMANALKLGDKGLADFHAAAEQAGKIARELGLDMAKLDAVQKKNVFHAEGKLAPAEQGAQIAQQFMRQSMRQVSNQFMQMAQGSFQKIMGGPAELDQLIADAKAKGDPVRALDLIIQNVQMKVGQAATNLHMLATSSMLGNVGGFPGVDNSAYLKSTGDPAAVALQHFTDLLNSLQQQRADVVAHQAHPMHVPHMAKGGIVEIPTVAQIGESGPEAVIPLNTLWQQLRQTFGGTLQQFSANASYWSQQIGQQMNVGNIANVGILDNFARQQEAMRQSLTAFQQHRQINLQPAAGEHAFGGTNVFGSPWRREPAPYQGGMTGNNAGPNITVNVHGADLTTPAGARQVAESLVPHIDAVLRRMGIDTSGRSALRGSPQVGPLYNGSPTAYAR